MWYSGKIKDEYPALYQKTKLSAGGKNVHPIIFNNKA
jgi:hypothetical protein